MVHELRPLRLLNLGLLAVGVCLLGACARTPGPSAHSPLPSLPEPVVTLASGDTIEVKFLYWPELNQTQAIRPDGRITLELVNDVPADGLTPEALSQDLTKRYQGKLKDPVVTVIVRQLVNQTIYVGGEVRTPGQIPLQGRISALEAIMSAGGFDKRTAQPRNVVVVRRIDNKNFSTLLDLSQSLNGTDTQPFYLAPHDIVYVPRTKIDAVDQWVEQYINRVVPTTLLRATYLPNSRTAVGYGSN